MNRKTKMQNRHRMASGGGGPGQAILGAQRDTALMGGVHGQQNRNARVEQNFLL